jgi:Sec-independent protein secretion pathway component TatC
VPLIVLYEGGLLISRVVIRRRAKAAESDTPTESS